MTEDTKSKRLWALADLVLIMGALIGVREWARSMDFVGTGSMGVLAAVTVGTITMKLRGRSWTELGLKLPQGLKGWALNIGGAVLVMFITVGIIYAVIFPVLGNFFDPSQFSSGDTFSFFFGRPMVFITYIVLVAWIGAGIGEEMFSRGLMLNRIAELFGSTRIAMAIGVLGQAAFFGLAHAYQGVGGIFLTGSIGLVFGILYIAGRRNLLPLIIAHAAIDTISLTQLYLANPLP